MRGMVIEMNDEQLCTLKDLQGFWAGTVTMDFTVAEDERYAFIARTVKRFGLWPAEAIRKGHCAALSGTDQRLLASADREIPSDGSNSAWRQKPSTSSTQPGTSRADVSSTTSASAGDS